MIRILVSIVFIFLCGCSSDYSSFSDSNSDGFNAPMQEKQRAQNKYLAYRHNITVVVEKTGLPTTFKNIINTCVEDSEYKCLIMHSEQSGGDYSYGTIQLRVAPEGISKYVSLASDSGEIQQQSTSAEDLTDSVLDTEKRLAMLNSYWSKLKELEKNPNINIESLIKVASEMSEIQTQIEYTQGQKAKIYQRINMDVLNISLQTRENETFISPVGDALSAFGEDFAEGLAIFITAAAYLIPWLLLVILLVWFLRFCWVRSKRKKNS